MRGGRHRYLRHLFVVTVVVVGCSRPAARPPLPPADSSAVPKTVRQAVLAEAECANPRLRVQVTEVTRAGAEAVNVKLRFVNPDPGAPVALGDAFADGPAAAGSISGAWLEDESGQKKVWVLRDDQGRPQGSTGLEPIPPGGAVEAWARFPLPAAGATRVTLRLPGVAALRDLPVGDAARGTGSAGPSY